MASATSAGAALPLSFDLLKYGFSYAPPIPTTPVLFTETRNVLYLPLKTLQILQLKPGTWVPLALIHQRLCHTDIKNSNNNNNNNNEEQQLLDDAMYSPQFCTVAQIQIYSPMYTDTTEYNRCAISNIIANNSDVKSGEENSNNLNTLLSRGLNHASPPDKPRVGSTPHHPLDNLSKDPSILSFFPQIKVNFGVSPSLLSLILLAFKAFNHTYSIQDRVDDYDVQYNLIISSIGFTSSLYHVDTPDTLHQSAIMSAQFCGLPTTTFSNSQPTITITHPAQQGFIVDGSIMCTSLATHEKTQLFANNNNNNNNLTCGNYVQYNIITSRQNNQAASLWHNDLSPFNLPHNINPNYNILNSNNNNNNNNNIIPITFHSLQQYITTIKPIFKQRFVQQSKIDKKQHPLSLQVLCINAMSSILHFIFQRTWNFVPQKQPTIINPHLRTGAIPIDQPLNFGTRIIKTQRPLQISPYITTQQQQQQIKQQITKQPQQQQNQPYVQILLHLLSKDWVKQIDYYIKGYASTLSLLTYNILTSLLTPLSTQRIIPLLVTGSVGTGKSTFAEYFTQSLPWIVNHHFDLSSVNLIDFHQHLYELCTRLQLAIADRVVYEVFIENDNNGNQGQYQIVAKNNQPLIHTLILDNLDVLFIQENTTNNGLNRVKHEIVQMLLNFMHLNMTLQYNNTLFYTQQKKQNDVSSSSQSNTIPLYPIVLLLFTTRSLTSASSGNNNAGTSSSSSSNSTSPHQNQKMQQLQQNITYQQFISSIHYKFNFQPLTLHQRFVVLKHYLEKIQISYKPSYFSLPSSQNVLTHDGCNQCKQCDNMIYPLNNNNNDENINNKKDEQTTTTNNNKFISYTKDDILLEWASTLHGCTPAVIQQLCSLAIVRSYKRHFDNEENLTNDQNYNESVQSQNDNKNNNNINNKNNNKPKVFTSQHDLCLSHQEWCYALELCKLYHALPRVLTPHHHQQYVQDMMVLEQQTDDNNNNNNNNNKSKTPSIQILTQLYTQQQYKTLQTILPPIFQQYWGGYISQLLQLTTLFNLTPQGQQQVSSLQINPAAINCNLLLTGVSGTGKTKLIELLSHILKLKIINIDIASLTSKFVGGSNALITNIFHQAQMNRPCILLFENLDTFIINKTKYSQYNPKTGKYQKKRQISYCTTLLETILKQLDNLAYLRENRIQIKKQNHNGNDNNNNNDVHDNDILNDPFLQGLSIIPPPLPLQFDSTQQQQEEKQQQHKVNNNNSFNDIVVVGTTHLPLSQIPSTLITSTRFLHTISLSPPTFIQRIQIAALLLTEKPFCKRQQYFERSNINKDNNNNNNNTDIKYNNEQFVFVQNNNPQLNHTNTNNNNNDSDDDMQNLIQLHQQQYEDINQYFPTYQHISVFIALFAVNLDKQQKTNDSNNNKNAPKQHNDHVTAVTLSSIIDASVIDAVRDNIEFQKKLKELNNNNNNNIQEQQQIFPLTPKNVVKGVQAICSYDISKLSEDIILVNDYLQKMEKLVNKSAQKHYESCNNDNNNNNNVVPFILRQQTTFSLPDVIEEFEYFYHRQ